MVDLLGDTDKLVATDDVVVVEFVRLVADGVDEVDNSGGGGSGIEELESTRTVDDVGVKGSVVRESG